MSRATRVPSGIILVDGERRPIDFGMAGAMVGDRKPFYLIHDDNDTPFCEYYALPVREDSGYPNGNVADDHPVYRSAPGDSWTYWNDGAKVSATLVGTYVLREYEVDQETGKVIKVLGEVEHV